MIATRVLRTSRSRPSSSWRTRHSPKFRQRSSARATWSSVCDGSGCQRASKGLKEQLGLQVADTGVTASKRRRTFDCYTTWSWCSAAQGTMKRHGEMR